MFSYKKQLLLLAIVMLSNNYILSSESTDVQLNWHRPSSFINNPILLNPNQASIARNFNMLNKTEKITFVQFVHMHQNNTLMNVNDIRKYEYLLSRVHNDHTNNQPGLSGIRLIN